MLTVSQMKERSSTVDIWEYRESQSTTYCCGQIGANDLDSINVKNRLVYLSCDSIISILLHLSIAFSHFDPSLFSCLAKSCASPFALEGRPFKPTMTQSTWSGVVPLAGQLDVDTAGLDFRWMDVQLPVSDGVIQSSGSL